MSEPRVPGRWFRTLFRSTRPDQVEEVASSLRQARVSVLLEEIDRAGGTRVVCEGARLRARSTWRILVPEDAHREACRTLRKRGLPIATGREGQGVCGEDDDRVRQVALWTGVLLLAVLALAVTLQVWPGNLELSRELVGNALMVLLAALVAIALPVYLAGRDARRWLDARDRRFVADEERPPPEGPTHPIDPPSGP